MKTKSINLRADILLVLYQNKELWMTSFNVSCLCVIPPDRLARFDVENKGKFKASNMVSQSIRDLCAKGMTEKRKVNGRKNEYRITQKGIEYIEKVKGENR